MTELGRRFGAGGPAVIPMTAVQRRARRTVAAKLAGGEYALERVACPGCGSDVPRRVADRDRYGLPAAVNVCGGCGLLYTSPRLGGPALGQLYDAEYRALDRGAPEGSEAVFAGEREKGQALLASLERSGLVPASDGLVLEVGTGSGGVLAPFADRGHPVLGVDPGTDYVGFGRARGLDLRVGDLATAAKDLADRAIRPQLIIYEQVLEHVGDPLAELRAAGQLVAPGGHVFVSVPGLRNIDAQYDSDFLAFLQLVHLSHFELGTLDGLAGRAGLRLVEGSEAVRALFTPDAALETGEVSGTDPDEVVSYLHDLEARRRDRGLLERSSAMVRRLRFTAGSEARVLADRVRGGGR